MEAHLVEEGAHLVVAQHLGYPAFVTEDYSEVQVLGDPTDFDKAVIAFAGAILRPDLTAPCSPADLGHVLRLHPEERQAALDKAVSILVVRRDTVLSLVKHWLADLG